jgi:hypothetical protein
LALGLRYYGGMSEVRQHDEGRWQNNRRIHIATQAKPT